MVVDRSPEDFARPTRIRIRLAVPDDATSIAAILHESFVEYRSSYTPEAFTATTPLGDQIQNRMKEGPMWVTVWNTSDYHGEIPGIFESWCPQIK